MSYCSFCRDLPVDNLHKIYHDFHYGFNIESNEAFFERLVLEINQAGLSWDLMLKKQINFREAFYNYDIERIANFTEKDLDILLQNPGIIRNKLKINAVIHNANVFLEIIKTHGSFKNWLLSFHPKTKEEWVKIFKKTFKFTGGEIVNEFLMSTGFLSGTHDEDCVIGNKLKKQKLV